MRITSLRYASAPSGSTPLSSLKRVAFSSNRDRIDICINSRVEVDSFKASICAVRGFSFSSIDNNYPLHSITVSHNFFLNRRCLLQDSGIILFLLGAWRCLLRDTGITVFLEMPFTGFRYSGIRSEVEANRMKIKVTTTKKNLHQNFCQLNLSILFSLGTS